MSSSPTTKATKKKHKHIPYRGIIPPPPHFKIAHRPPPPHFTHNVYWVSKTPLPYFLPSPLLNLQSAQARYF